MFAFLAEPACGANHLKFDAKLITSFNEISNIFGAAKKNFLVDGFEIKFSWTHSHTKNEVHLIRKHTHTRTNSFICTSWVLELLNELAEKMRTANAYVVQIYAILWYVYLRRENCFFLHPLFLCISRNSTCKQHREQPLMFQHIAAG